MESKSDLVSATFILRRQRGLFGDVRVFWNLTSGTNSSLDVSPTSGTLEFNENEKFKSFEAFSLDDNVSE